MSKPDIIPGTTLPNTQEGWQELFRCCSVMNIEQCDKILNANRVGHLSMVLLDYRKELSKLCRANGANPYAW